MFNVQLNTLGSQTGQSLDDAFCLASKRASERQNKLNSLNGMTFFHRSLDVAHVLPIVRLMWIAADCLTACPMLLNIRHIDITLSLTHPLSHLLFELPPSLCALQMDKKVPTYLPRQVQVHLSACALVGVCAYEYLSVRLDIRERQRGRETEKGVVSNPLSIAMRFLQS